MFSERNVPNGTATKQVFAPRALRAVDVASSPQWQTVLWLYGLEVPSIQAAGFEPAARYVPTVCRRLRGQVVERSISAYGKSHHLVLPNIEDVLWAILIGLLIRKGGPYTASELPLTNLSPNGFVDLRGLGNHCRP
ncbi:MAG: hypothetical protein ACJ74Z_11820 [Bryobacteraceae bacterium]